MHSLISKLTPTPVMALPISCSNRILYKSTLCTLNHALLKQSQIYTYKFGL